MVNPIISEFMREIGTKGGKAKTKRKLDACRSNLSKTPTHKKQSSLGAKQPRKPQFTEIIVEPH